MQLLVATCAIGALAVSPCRGDEAAVPPDADSEWIQLFNGKDLTGWTPKIVGHAAGDNYADTFRVEDGVLRVSYDKYAGDFNDRFGHLFYKEPFSNYLLRVEYRIVGKQYPGGPDWGYANSGIMIHGQSPESMGLNQLFPVSLEVQLLGSDEGKPQPTGSVCTPGMHIVIDGQLYTPHRMLSTAKSYPLGEWVTAEVEVHGGRLIRHKINGETVLEYSQPQLDEDDTDAKQLIAAGAEKMITGGTISLQSESHPIEFRKVELKRLVE
jgi:hypothetical protein